MKESDRDLISSVAREHDLQVRWTDFGCEILLKSGDDRLSVMEKKDEVIITDEGWHLHPRHLETGHSVAGALSAILDGSLKIFITYRGGFPVGSAMRLYRDGEPVYQLHTFQLLSPFWRKKTYEELDYTGGVKRRRPCTPHRRDS